MSFGNQRKIMLSQAGKYKDIKFQMLKRKFQKFSKAEIREIDERRQAVILLSHPENSNLIETSL